LCKKVSCQTEYAKRPVRNPANKKPLQFIVTFVTMDSNTLSHLTTNDTPQMVDVSLKKDSNRVAKARAEVLLPQSIVSQLTDRELHLPKGPVFQTAILAGIMGAKKTADLIPLCHTLLIDSVKIDIELQGQMTVITSEVRTTGKTGVEMEALTAVSVAALTIYDMCKALSPDITIGPIQLMEKTGGKNDFKRNA
jgi:cyclic pyranopterin phosphate synthase